jgi:hypothetical protein
MKPIATFRRTSTMAVISVPTMEAISAMFRGGTEAALLACKADFGKGLFV